MVTFVSWTVRIVHGNQILVADDQGRVMGAFHRITKTAIPLGYSPIFPLHETAPQAGTKSTKTRCSTTETVCSACTVSSAPSPLVLRLASRIQQLSRQSSNCDRYAAHDTNTMDGGATMNILLGRGIHTDMFLDLVSMVDAGDKVHIMPGSSPSHECIHEPHLASWGAC